MVSDKPPKECRHSGWLPSPTLLQPDRGTDKGLMPRSSPRPPDRLVDRDGRIIDEDTPVPRKPPDEDATVAVKTQPHRTSDTDRLPSMDAPATIPREPTVMLDAPAIDMLDAQTTKVESAESEAAPAVDAPFDRVEWSADRLGSVADALRADRRIHAADLIAGARAGMVVGAVRGPLQHVASKLVQRALLADAGVGAELDPQQVANMLFELAADILVGVEPTRRASRALALKLEERARAIGHAKAKAEARGDADAVAEHRGRQDELVAAARELRRTSR